MDEEKHLLNLNRREFLKRATVSGISVVGSSPFMVCKSRQKRPNILVLLTDDQRWDALGCMGNPIIQTPNIDGLAKNGSLFTNMFVTTSICMSSRASILTGQYVRRHGINKFSQNLTPTAMAQTYPMILKDAGYRVGFIGKFGIGTTLPTDQFDFFRGFSGQGHYFPKEHGGAKHLTEIIGDNIIEFLRSGSQNEPFCLSVSFKAPHVQDGDPKQFLYDPTYEKLYEEATIPNPATATPHHFEVLPDFLKNSEARRRWQIRFSTPDKFQNSVKGYYRLITGIDGIVGRVIEELQKQGVADDTIIIYTGDNGFFLGEHGLAGKWFMYEESIRVPLIIWGKRLPSFNNHQQIAEMVLNIDLAPTVLDLVGVNAPPQMQGRSLWPLIQTTEESWRTAFFYEHLFEHRTIPKSEGIRTKNWKYVRYIDQAPIYEQLFDLKNDPHEEINLVNIKKNRNELENLRNKWQEMRKSVI